MNNLKAKLEEARKSTKVAIVGGAIVVAGAWGSCQLQLIEPTPEAPEAAAEPAPEPEAEPAVEEAPEAKEAEPSKIE